MRLASEEQIEEVMTLVRQAFDQQTEEGYEEPQWSQAGVERVVEEAADPAVQTALLTVVEAAVRNGLYPRPWKRSLMFAPAANRTRALFTLTIRDDDRIDLWSAAEGFETFYGLDQATVERQLGSSGPTALQAQEVVALGDRLDELMAESTVIAVARGYADPTSGFQMPPASAIRLRFKTVCAECHSELAQERERYGIGRLVRPSVSTV